MTTPPRDVGTVEDEMDRRREALKDEEFDYEAWEQDQRDGQEERASIDLT